jgi:hypothetical protein
VSLTEEYVEKRDSNVLDDSAIANMYVFEPAPPPELRSSHSEFDSNNGDSQFVALGKKGKSASFKGDGRKDTSNIRDNHSRSSSFGSTLSVDTTTTTTRKPPSSRSPGKKYNKVDQHGGIRLSAQEYQQYQQYQMHMMREQQRYQMYMQQQQSGQQSLISHHVHDVSVMGGDNVSTSPRSIPPPIPIPSPTNHSPPFSGGYVPQYSPSHQQMYPIGGSYSPQASPGSSPAAGGYFYDQNGNMYYPPPGGVLHHNIATSPTAARGVAIRHHNQDSGVGGLKSPKKERTSEN